MLVVQDVKKSFDTEAGPLEILKGVSMTLEKGQAAAITGPSGSGKSTLLHLVGTLDRPSSGQIVLEGREIHSLEEDDLARFRNRTIGFIFQNHHLLPQYSVLENVLVPTLPFGAEGDAKARAEELLGRVGLADRLEHRPAMLSGGERQRVAVARALIHRPAVMLCDEPTGSLDQESAGEVADLLFELHREEENVLIVVTHNQALADRFEIRHELRAGRFSAA